MASGAADRPPSRSTGSRARLMRAAARRTASGRAAPATGASTRFSSGEHVTAAITSYGRATTAAPIGGVIACWKAMAIASATLSGCSTSTLYFAKDVKSDAVSNGLMGALQRMGPRDRSDERHDGIALGGGRQQAGDEIRGPGPGRGETHTRASRQASDGRRHEGGILLVTAHDELWTPVDERIEHTVDLGPRIPKMCWTPCTTNESTRTSAPVRARSLSLLGAKRRPSRVVA